MWKKQPTGLIHQLHVITDTQLARGRSLAEIVSAAISGGATVIQLREKSASTRDIIALGQVLHTITQTAGIPLIVNDRIDIALAINAEGAHVGQEDMPAPLARRLLGPTKILGVSASRLNEARQAQADGADYIGVGDIFGTQSKTNTGFPIGLDSLSEIVQGVSTPTIAIGGITSQNAHQVIQSGASGIAVISAVIGAKDVRNATHQLRAIIDA